MSPPSAAAITIADVSKRFGEPPGEITALDKVSLEIRTGEFFTLLGPSGCGKTTLLRLIAGFEQPSGGEIRLEGEPIAHLPPFRRAVNTVFQSYALFPHLTVARNVAFGLEMQGHRRAQVEEGVAAALALVRLQDLGDRYPRQLSGGQQQRVALARALAAKPRVLLLDEPLSAVDFKLRKEMQAELKRMQAETGITFVFVTHDQQEALTMSDRIAVMDHGHVLQVGNPYEIYDRPASRFVADFVGETNLIEATCTELMGDRVTFRLNNGKEIEAHDVQGVGVGTTALLAVRPERLVIDGENAEGLPATIEGSTYLGTDTVCQVRLTGGSRLIARFQNRRGAVRPRTDLKVVVRIPPDAIQVLRD